MDRGYDAIIIGGGHNGLICGAYLAKAGLKTIILERRSIVGGAAVSESVIPGFTFSVFSYLLGLLHPKIMKDLDLRGFGLEVLPAANLFCPLGNGDYITYSEDRKKTYEQFRRFSQHDADNYEAFHSYMQDAVKLLHSLLFQIPIDPTKRSWRSFKDTARFLWSHRKIGQGFYRLIDILTMSADDYLSSWFENDIIKAVFAYTASTGTFAGPKSPGTAYVVMHHQVMERNGAWGFVRGGMGSVSQAIAKSGARYGLTIKTDCDVAEVIVRNGRAVGVRTGAGDEYFSQIVASNASCKVLFLDLISEGELPSDFLREIRSFRTFSTAFKINIACEAPPRYKGFDAASVGFDYPGFVHIGPDIDYLERAYEDAKHGWYSARPFITPSVPTMADDSIAPAGKHVVHLFGGHAPYDLKNGNWEHERDSFTRNTLNTLDEFAPGFSSGIIGMQVLTPRDIEHALNLPHGHIFHGELSLDQLFFQRPAPGYADYRTPLKGLYQCGSSTHPGGGVSGIPGHNAAREILRDARR